MDHAVVICTALHRLPVGLPTEKVEAVEAALVELAGKTDPTGVAVAGRRGSTCSTPTARCCATTGSEPGPHRRTGRRRPGSAGVRGALDEPLGLGALVGDERAERAARRAEWPAAWDRAAGSGRWSWLR